VERLNDNTCVFRASLQIIHILKYVDDNRVDVMVLVHLINIPPRVHMVQ